MILWTPVTSTGFSRVMALKAKAAVDVSHTRIAEGVASRIMVSLVSFAVSMMGGIAEALRELVKSLTSLSGGSTIFWACCCV